MTSAAAGARGRRHGPESAKSTTKASKMARMYRHDGVKSQKKVRGSVREEGSSRAVSVSNGPLIVILLSQVTRSSCFTHHSPRGEATPFSVSDLADDDFFGEVQSSRASCSSRGKSCGTVLDPAPATTTRDNDLELPLTVSLFLSQPPRDLFWGGER